MAMPSSASAAGSPGAAAGEHMHLVPGSDLLPGQRRGLPLGAADQWMEAVEQVADREPVRDPRPGRPREDRLRAAPPGVVARGGGGGRLAELCAQRRIAPRRCADRRRQGAGVIGRHEQRVLSRPEHLAERRQVAGHDRAARGEILEELERREVSAGARGPVGEEKHVGGAEERRHLRRRHGAGEAHVGAGGDAMGGEVARGDAPDDEKLDLREAASRGEERPHALQSGETSRIDAHEGCALLRAARGRDCRSRRGRGTSRSSSGSAASGATRIFSGEIPSAASSGTSAAAITTMRST